MQNAGGLIPEERHLNCPGCSAKVADGTSICPRCDYIIDDSFLSAPSSTSGAAGEGGESTHVGPPPDAEPRGRPARRSRSTPAAATARRASPRSREHSGARNVLGDDAGSPDTDPGVSPPEPINGARRSASSPSPARQPARTPPRRSEARPTSWPDEPHGDPGGGFEELEQEARPSLYGGNITSPQEELARIQDFISNLGSADKIAFTGAALTVLVSFFPWKETVAEGDVLGLLSLGAVATAMAMLTIVAIVVRVQRFLPRLNPMFPWLVQLGACCFAILWCLVYIKVSWNGTRVHAIEGNTLKPISMPAVGVFLGLLSSLLSLGGTLLGLKDKQA